MPFIFFMRIIGCARRITGSNTWAKRDRKSTRLNSSHLVISYAVFCLKKKKTAVVIHPETAPAVHIFDREDHLIKLRVEPGGFLPGFFDGSIVRHSGSAVNTVQL